MWASPVGTGMISAGINAGIQYYQNGVINPVDVAFTGIAGGVGTYGGLLWNMGVNTISGAANTALNNYLYGQDNSVIGNALASGTLSSIGYGVGKLGEDGVNVALRPTTNIPNWAATGTWSSGGWNLFRPNNTGVIGGTITGSLGQENASSLSPTSEQNK